MRRAKLIEVIPMAQVDCKGLAEAWRELERDARVKARVEAKGNAEIKRAKDVYTTSGVPVLANSGYYWEVVRGVNLAAKHLAGETAFALVNFPHVCNRSCNFCFTTFKAKSEAHRNSIPLASAHETAAQLFIDAAENGSALGKTVSENVNPLSLEDLKRFTDAFAAAGGRSFEVSGWGESTLFKEFPDFVRHAAKRGIPVTLITNAELERDYWCEVVEAVLDGKGAVVVSFHHVKPEKHAKYLGGVFKRAFGNIRVAAEIAESKGLLRAKENGIIVSHVATHTTVMPENIRDLKELQEKVRSLGVFVSLAPVGLVGLAEQWKEKPGKLEEFLFYAQTAWLPDVFQNGEEIPEDVASRVSEVIKSFPHKGDNSIIHSVTSEALFSEFAEFAGKRGLQVPKARQVCATFAYGVTLDTLTGALLPDAHGFELLNLIGGYPKVHEILRGELDSKERSEALRRAMRDSWAEHGLPLFVASGCFFCPIRSPLYGKSVSRLAGGFSKCAGCEAGFG